MREGLPQQEGRAPLSSLGSRLATFSPNWRRPNVVSPRR